MWGSWARSNAFRNGMVLIEVGSFAECFLWDYARGLRCCFNQKILTTILLGSCKRRWLDEIWSKKRQKHFCLVSIRWTVCTAHQCLRKTNTQKMRISLFDSQNEVFQKWPFKSSRIEDNMCFRVSTTDALRLNYAIKVGRDNYRAHFDNDKICWKLFLHLWCSSHFLEDCGS